MRRVTLWGLLINLALAGCKFAAGLAANSQALVADAVHSLSDTATDVAVLVGARFWSAPADQSHPHGHGRIETIVTLLIGVALASVGVGLGYHALATLMQPHPIPPGWLAFAAAIASIGVKEWLYRWTVRVGRRVRSSAMIANAWHHRSDAFSSVPVAVAVLGAHIYPQWAFLDHIATVLVAVLILQAAWHICWPALRQLTDAGANEEVITTLRRLASQTQGVLAIHALRTRYVGPGLHVDLHVLVDPLLSVRDGHSIAGHVKQRLLEEGPNVLDVLVHIEPFERARPAEPAD